MTSYLKLKNDLFFVMQKVETEKIEHKVINSGVHHVFILDCSGSMWDQLPIMRKDLYNKIATGVLKPNDSISLIWFSGRGEYGVILENFSIKSGQSLNKVRELIDHYLRPVCLTAFKEPLEEAGRVIERVIETDPNAFHSLFFLTDGYDNSWSTNEILKAVTSIKEKLNSATVVEYGWYCNRKLLDQMATEFGGAHKFSQDLQDYEPIMEKQFSLENRVERKQVQLDNSADFDLVYTLQNDEFIAYAPDEENKILIGATDDTTICYFTKYEPNGAGYYNDGDSLVSNYLSEKSHSDTISNLYAALFGFSRKNNYSMVSEILSVLGDADLIIRKANTFGTQKITELEDKFLTAALDDSKRFTLGYDPNLEPPADAYNVLDMLEDLMESDENKFYPRHKLFEYKRIGSKQVNKSKADDGDKKLLEELSKKGDLDAIVKKITEIKQASADVKFSYAEPNPGIPFTDLVWNEKRANLSVRAMYKGTVNIPKNSFGVPEIFSTKIFRNYTLVKDGVINMYKIPISLSVETFAKLQKNGLLKNEVYVSGVVYLLDFSELPVANREMIDSLSAEELFRNSYELLTLQAQNTVFNHFRKMRFSGLGVKFMEQYTEDGAKWLKEIGVTESGFNPPKEVERTNEEIFVNTLVVKTKGLTLMTSKKDFEKVLGKFEEGADLTERESLLIPAIKEFKDFERLNEGLSDDTIFNGWLDQKSKLFRKRKTELMNNISRSKFLTIVGKAWFKEFESREEKSLTLDINGEEIVFEIEDKESKIKL